MPLRHPLRPPLRLAVMLSGSGRTLENLAKAIHAGRLDARIAGVISSRRDVAGVARARGLGLRVGILRPVDFPSRQAFWKATSEALDRLKPDLVVMAGYLCYWQVPRRWAGRVVNIHPSLLPKFGGKGCYGHHVHEKVLAAGVKTSGCTVHLVDNVYDHGKVLAQAKVPVKRSDTPDTLAARVFRAECRLYPALLQDIAAGRLRLSPPSRPSASSSSP